MLADSQGGAQCEHKVDMCPCGSSLMMSDCQRTDVLGWVWELTVARVVLCNVFLGLWYTGVEVGGGSRRWRWRSGGSVPTDWERWRTDAGTGLRDKEAGWLAAMTDTWGHRQAQEYMGDSVDQVKTAVEQVEWRLKKTWCPGGQGRQWHESMRSEDRWWDHVDQSSTC